MFRTQLHSARLWKKVVQTSSDSWSLVFQLSNAVTAKNCEDDFRKTIVHRTEDIITLVVLAEKGPSTLSMG